MISLSHPARLGLYLAVVTAVTLVHQPIALMLLLAGVLLLSGKGRVDLVLCAARPVAWVLLLISSGYLLMGWLAGQPALAALLLINLRVLVLALLTAWMMRDVDLDNALARWPNARRWLVVVRGQMLLFRRLVRDYRHAQRSRAVVPPTLRQRYLGSAAIGLAALDKGVYNAEMVTQAMRSRGALHD
jgi:cobalt/nickel transport system permease protein